MTRFLQLRLGRLRTDFLFPGSLHARFARGALWSLVASIIAHGFTLTASTGVARLLGVVGFGELGIINNTLGTLGLFAGLGLGLTATKHVAEFRYKDPNRAGRIIGLLYVVAIASAGIASVLLFALAPELATAILNAPHLANELRIGCGILFLSTLIGVQTSILSGFESFRLIAGVNLIQGLFKLPLMLAGVWVWGLVGAIGALVLVNALNWILNQLAIQRECDIAGFKVHYDNLSSELPVLWRFSVPAFLSNVMVGPGIWITSVMLVNQAGGYTDAHV